MNTAKTINWILYAKGIGILLVVAGHFYPDNAPEAWQNMVAVIYRFHMPLFFILSGCLYKGVCGAADGSSWLVSYTAFVVAKFKRLMIPFFSVGLVYFFVKGGSGTVLQLDNPVNLHSIIHLITDPYESFAPILWFVHTLFIISLAYPILQKILRNDWCILGVLWIIGMFNFPVLERIVDYMPYVIIGALLRPSVLGLSDYKLQTVLNVGVLISCLLVFVGVRYVPETVMLQYVYGCAGAFFVMRVALFMDAYQVDWLLFRRVLHWLGYYSMTIYLFHTLFSSATRILLNRILFNSAPPFELVALVSITAGLVIPGLVECYFLRKSVIVRRVVLGLP